MEIVEIAIKGAISIACTVSTSAFPSGPTQPQHSLKAGFLPRVFPIELSNSSLAEQALEILT